MLPKMKKIKNKYLFLIPIVVVLLPCKFFGFLDSKINLLLFKICCVALIMYGCKLGVQQSVLATLIVLIIFYKVNNLCYLRFTEGLVDYKGVNPFLNTNMLIPMDMANKRIRVEDLVTYENNMKNIENIRNKSILGKLYEHQTIPKLCSFRNKDEIDRGLKANSEMSSSLSSRLPTSIHNL